MDAITDVEGIRVGQAHNQDQLTGCSVVFSEGDGACGGFDLRGGAPGTRELGLLAPDKLVDTVNAILLTGGSAFGLAAAEGVMEYLSERKLGFDAGTVHVPIVPAAVLFDLQIGEPVWPDAAMGYAACENLTASGVEMGSFGAGCGATVGKVLGPEHMMKGGIGSAAETLHGGVRIGALVAVNTFGDVRDPESGEIVAGTYISEEERFADTLQVMRESRPLQKEPYKNTTIGVVATDADLTRPEVQKVAQMSQDGLARALSPAHTMVDGDLIFSMATGRKGRVDLSLLGAVGARVVVRAILRAVRMAEGCCGLPSAKDL